MKKSILAFVVLFALVLLLAGCGGPKLKDARVKVAALDINGDTLRSMKATLDGDTLLFSLKDARLNNGLMLHGDSVIVNYIKGRGDTLRALVVTILPKAPVLFNPDEAKGDSLVTAGMDIREETDSVQ